MIDYSKYDKTGAAPDAGSMIETFRAIGYNIETAIADIIDNSISAGAENIWINFDWKGSDTWLSVKDDGCGMNNQELIQAMKPGSKNPLEIRDEKDLGRFGFGLKTASFSQCRTLSVASKKKNEDVVYWTWDLDFIKHSGKWELIGYVPGSGFVEELSNLKSGTVIIWSNIDRLVKNYHKDDKKALDKFLQTMEGVKKHLAMVFHRFIESRKTKIYFQERVLEPWNPFLIEETATQGFPEEYLEDGKVTVKGYVLPHKSKITDEKYKMAEGPKGWGEQQGFYIYRNERLLLAGDWLGLYRKEEHYKLARIRIDIPNTLDEEWQIDIKKSVARPPAVLKEQLKAYAGQVRNQAVEVYRQKGKSVKQLPGQKFVPLWVEFKRGDKWFYRINREHPLIGDTISQANAEQSKAVERLLRFIEETLPSKSVYIKEATDEEALGKPFEGIDQEPIRKTMKQMYDKLIADGKTDIQARSVIANIEPFNHFLHFLEFIN